MHTIVLYDSDAQHFAACSTHKTSPSTTAFCKLETSVRQLNKEPKSASSAPKRHAHYHPLRVAKHFGFLPNQCPAVSALRNSLPSAFSLLFLSVDYTRKPRFLLSGFLPIPLYLIVLSSSPTIPLFLPRVVARRTRQTLRSLNANYPVRTIFQPSSLKCSPGVGSSLSFPFLSFDFYTLLTHWKHPVIFLFLNAAILLTLTTIAQHLSYLPFRKYLKPSSQLGCVRFSSAKVC